jgi:DNA-binding transcriptional MerR regulator
LAELRKSDQAFRTIGELAEELGVPQHILRYWETRFPQLRPLQRAGNRRYYRPADVALAQRIHRLLNQDGYTIRGVQQLLSGGMADGEEIGDGTPAPATGTQASELRKLRKTLKDALDGK